MVYCCCYLNISNYYRTGSRSTYLPATNIANIAVTVDALGEVELSETDVLVYAALTNPTQ